MYRTNVTADANLQNMTLWLFLTHGHACLCVADVVIRERLKDVEKVENENVKFQCRVKNAKNYPVSWLKDGKPLQNGDR